MTVGEHIISTMRQSSTGLNGQAVAFVSLFHDGGGGHDALSGSRHRALERGDQGWQLAIGGNGECVGEGRCMVVPAWKACA